MPPKKQQHNEAPKDKFTEMNAEQLFKYFSKPNKDGKLEIDELGVGGILTEILKIKEEDLLTFFILGVCMGTPKIGHIGLEHINNLFYYCKCKDVGGLRNYLPQLEKIMSQEETYRDMYMKSFDLFLVKHTTLDYETAVYLWGILLAPNFKYWEKFLKFMQQEGKKPARIHKDSWFMLYQFATKVHDFEKDYNENDNWPVLIDQFVDYLKESK